jgi:hypothetical protein
MEAGSKFIDQGLQQSSFRCSHDPPLLFNNTIPISMSKNIWISFGGTILSGFRHCAFLNQMCKVTWFGMGESAAPSMADADASVAKVFLQVICMQLALVFAQS